MPQVKLRLEGGREAWEPKELLSGNANLSHDSDWVADYVELVVWWSTAGKGDQDTGVVHREMLAKKDETVPARREFSFRVKLPTTPWTYHGRLIKIDWYVGLYAKERGKAEDAIMTPIRVFPGGGREISPDNTPDVRDSLLPDAPPPDVL